MNLATGPRGPELTAPPPVPRPVPPPAPPPAPPCVPQPAPARTGAPLRRRRSARIRSLDGLRGLAALLVLVHHCLVAMPYFDGTATDAGFRRDPAFWWVYTPLHGLWAGGELVYVFFILSGLVLSWPYLAGKPLRYRAYLPARLIRLYLPAWGSLVLAAALLVLLPRRAEPGLALGLQDEVGPLTWPHLLRSATMVMQATHLNFALWSIRWEIFFSALLPLYVLAARRIDVRGWRLAAAVAACAGVCAIGEVLAQGALLYLPMFAIGTLLARRLTQRPGARRPADRSARAVALFGLGWLTLSAHWWLGVWFPRPQAGLVAALVVAGAGAIVVSAVRFRPFTRFLETVPLQFAGKISFSLYVTHLPLVFGLAFWLGPGSVGVLPVLAVPLALGVAVLFHRYVESPSHRLARWQGLRG